MTDNNFQAYEQTWQHIDLVIKLLMSAQIELMKRIATHDRTKLIPPEREMFAEMTHKLAGLIYGSPEYQECLSEMLGKALGHHYSHNRHHPEYFEKREECYKIKNHQVMAEHSMNNNTVLPDDVFGYENLIKYLEVKQTEHISSINEMNLFDVLEMLIDWVAATKRHNDGDINKSIEINTKRFFLSPQLVEILKNTVLWIDNSFEGLDNQKLLTPPNK